MNIAHKVLLYTEFKVVRDHKHYGTKVYTQFLGHEYHSSLIPDEVQRSMAGDIKAWKELIEKKKMEVAEVIASDILEYIIPERGEWLRQNSDGDLIHNEFTNKITKFSSESE